jgi:uncharacterized protein with GYD domain
MASYVVLANWTEQGIKAFQESPARVDAFNEQTGALGVRVKDIYWTLGPYDMVTLIEGADDESITAALLKLGAWGNLRTTTLRAFTRTEFEALASR